MTENWPLHNKSVIAGVHKDDGGIIQCRSKVLCSVRLLAESLDRISNHTKIS